MLANAGIKFFLTMLNHTDALCALRNSQEEGKEIAEFGLEAEFTFLPLQHFQPDSSDNS